MTRKRQRQEPDLAAIEKRERHLWVITLFLLLLFAVTIAIVFLVLLDSVPLPGQLPPLVRDIALGSLLLLLGLFSAYVLHTHINFGSIRSLYLQQAIRDPLTGLLNRQSFKDRFEEEVARAKRAQRPFAILLCDLDNFKAINDSHGHQVGDEVLQLVAKSTLRATRGLDLVFRWGGDEILVLLSAPSREGAFIAARRIRDSVREVGQSRQLSLDLSIGIAFYPTHASEMKQLIRLADKALYIAKKGGDKIHVGEEDYELNDRSVRTVFQPVVDLKTKKITGYEALSRDPKGQKSIIDLFKRYAAVGQLAELKRIIFRKQVRAAEQLALKRVFINIDFETLETVEPFPKPVAVEVVLEISEAESLHDLQQSLETVAQWRKLGYKFAIDDFGAGFVSLRFISKLIPNYLKVDRSSVIAAVGSAEFGGFLKDLIAAMRNYSRDGIIAEGIETEKELEAVTKIGVDQVQGYLTGRPDSLKDRR